MLRKSLEHARMNTEQLEVSFSDVLIKTEIHHCVVCPQVNEFEQMMKQFLVFKSRKQIAPKGRAIRRRSVKEFNFVRKRQVCLNSNTGSILELLSRLIRRLKLSCQYSTLAFYKAVSANLQRK